MVALSIMIEGQDGLTWARWQNLVREVEDLGFAGLFRSDHFTNKDAPDKDSLEMIVSLTYLADIPTRMARFQEGIEVVTQLLHSDEPVTFEGKYFQLREAILLPRPLRP